MTKKPPQDTSLGGEGAGFPETTGGILSVLGGPGPSTDRSNLEGLCRKYWKPVYVYIRIAWAKANEDAKDLTQAFFVHLLEGDLLAKADPERGNFRKLLMAALRNFLSNEARADKAEKRGGGRTVVSLDGDAGDSWASDPADPAEAFEAQWAREILERSIGLLGERCRPEVYAAFRRFHLEEASVKQIAAETRATEAQVAHHLQDARGILRRLVTDEIRRYVQDESEIVRELETLFRGWR